MAKDNSTGKKFFITALTAGALYGLYRAFAQKNAINQLRVDVKDIKLSFKNTAFQINLNLSIDNPTSETLQFRNFTGKIYLDSQQAGTLDIPNPVQIKPRSNYTVPLTAVVPLATITKQLVNILLTKQVPTKGIIDGIVNIGNLQLPVYQVFNFTIPKLG
jgi:LEA14-like dessication related protein